MSTLLYSPGIRVVIQTAGNGIVDVSDDLARFSLTLAENLPSTFSFTLVNHRRKYDGIFTPNDTISVQMKRIRWMPVFAGYLDQVPYYSVYPRDIELTATDTLKRLKYHLWDPGAEASVSLINNSLKNNRDPSSSGADGGMSDVIVKVLTKVGRWPASKIHIGMLPDNWYSHMEPLRQTIASTLDNGPGVTGTSKGKKPGEHGKKNKPPGHKPPSTVHTGGAQASNRAGADAPPVAPVGSGLMDTTTGFLPSTYATATTFGGPDTVGRASLTGEFLAAPKDQWYVQMRWPYTLDGTTPTDGTTIEEMRAAQNWWKDQYLLVTNPRNFKAVVLRAADWGPLNTPGTEDDAGIGVSPHVLKTILGSSEGKRLDVKFAPDGAPLGNFIPPTTFITGTDRVEVSQRIDKTPQPGTSSIVVPDDGDTASVYVDPAILSAAPEVRAGAIRAGVNTPGGGGTGGNHFTPEQAIARCAYQSANGPTFEPWTCQKQDRLVYGVTADGTLDPVEGWANSRHKHATSDPTGAPIGALHMWTGGSSGHGHIAIDAGDGDGTVWSSDIQRLGYFDKTTVQYINQHWTADHYVGWCTDICGVVVTSGGTTTDSGPSTTDIINSWFVAKENLKANVYAAEQFAKQAWPSIKSIGGYANRTTASGGHSEHSTGQALDFMVSAPDTKAAGDDRALGNTIAQWFVNNPKVFDAWYVIWMDRINSGTSPTKGWDTYDSNAGNGNTVQHRDHVHVSFYDHGQTKVGPMGGGWAGGNDSDFTGGFTTTKLDVTGVTAGTSSDTSLVNTFNWYPQESPESYALTGYRALMNDVPLLGSVQKYVSASMRSFMAGPNGDFISWFPDYFGAYGHAAKMIINDIEIAGDGFTMVWDDSRMVTHQYASGSWFEADEGADPSGGAIDIQRMALTQGVATVEFPELMSALFNLPPEALKEGFFNPQNILKRFGARVDYQPMGLISSPEAEFWYACRMWQLNWASQFSSEVLLTFMPELWPGMLLKLETFGFQAYVEQVTHSGDYASTGMSGGFRTTVRVIAPSSSKGGGLYGLPTYGKFDPKNPPKNPKNHKPKPAPKDPPNRKKNTPSKPRHPGGKK